MDEESFKITSAVLGARERPVNKIRVLVSLLTSVMQIFAFVCPVDAVCMKSLSPSRFAISVRPGELTSR